MKCPRVLIAGTSSSCGKTTAVCAILSLLKRTGNGTGAFKCGPDYLDPSFHETVTGVPCTNLDPFFSDADHLRYLLHEYSGERLSIIEGVMGYYDGTGESGIDNSTYSVARSIEAPVILVVPAKGTSTSAMAVLVGFLSFVPQSRIAGVLFNGTSEAVYSDLRKKVLERFGGKVVPVGFIPNLPDDCLIPSRYLGLVNAGEINDIRVRLERIAGICRKTIDIEAIVSIADSATDLSFKAPEIKSYSGIRIAVAKDRAFFFYYRALLDLLVKMGAEIRYFSPLADEPVPEGSHGLLIGGGYPELYAEELERNSISRNSVASAVRSGMPTIAECGGFQYLGKKLCGKEMCGVLDHESSDCGKLVRFGYVTLTAGKDGLLGKSGTVLRGHEFHYYDSTDNGADFTARKVSGKTWDCAVSTETLYAGYPHLYLPADLPAVESFYVQCLKFKEDGG